MYTHICICMYIYMYVCISIYLFVVFFPENITSQFFLEPVVEDFAVLGDQEPLPGAEAWPPRFPFPCTPTPYRTLSTFRFEQESSLRQPLHSALTNTELQLILRGPSWVTSS